jgi:hypothetical protein
VPRIFAKWLIVQQSLGSKYLEFRRRFDIKVEHLLVITVNYILSSFDVVDPFELN